MSGYPGNVWIVDGARTPFLRATGRPGPFRASDLAVQAGRALLARQSFFGPEDLSEVVLGCVMPGPDEANIARVVALRLGCGKRVPAYTVQRNCASGMQALDSAALDIATGRADLVLAGGTESMSHAPLLLSVPAAHWLADLREARDLLTRLRVLARLRPSLLAPVVALLRGLTDPVAGLSMGQTAEIVAHRFGIDRATMDAYALESHRRAAAAIDAGHLAAETVPLFAPDGTLHEHDDGVRRDSSLERLARLKPIFDRPFGLVTAGSSSQITDGAAWLLLASDAAVARHGLQPLGRLVDAQWAGLDPAQMGLGPVHAMATILARHGLATDAVDLWEINEAFAAQVLGVIRAGSDAQYAREELGLPEPLAAIPLERLNVDGGAIAVGHPVGASGARIVLHLVHALRRHGGRRGLASLCIGGGQGGAMLVEATP